ncbi:hypothetical protein, partial [Staphylococcus aureus]|uniref:hypothetical protein n=1 Tax=Staphylococcus aureus TaxID=1280 RepID=UPI0020BF2B99
SINKKMRRCFMVSFKNIDWKLYFLLLIIILPLAIVTAFILPGLYKYLSFIWVFLFFILF